MSEGRVTKYRWLNPEGHDPQEQPLNVPTSAGAYFSLANLNDNFVFIVGGGADNRSTISAHGKTQRYNVAENSWIDLPNLNVSRQGAAACGIGDAVYVFCGMKANSEGINSVEFLENATAPSVGTWNIIEIES